MLPEISMVATRDLAENTVLVLYHDHDIPAWEERPLPLPFPLPLPPVVELLQDPTSQAGGTLVDALST